MSANLFSASTEVTSFPPLCYNSCCDSYFSICLSPFL